jgi:predicted phage tail protein
MSQTTKITLHGELGEVFGKTFNLAVASFSEAIHAINVKSKKQLYPWLFRKDKTGVKYKIVINGEDFQSDADLTVLDQKAVESVLVSDLTIKRKLKTIDIVPVLEGADADTLGIITLVIGVILIATGIGSPAGFTLLGISQGTLVLVGLALLAGGIISLLSQGPEFQDFRDISNSGKTSYLFSGPQNTVGEGGPVPIGYGRLIVGSQTIAASYRIKNIDAAAVIGPLDELGQILSSEIYALINSGVTIRAPVRAIAFESSGGFYVSLNPVAVVDNTNGVSIVYSVLYWISQEFKLAQDIKFTLPGAQIPGGNAAAQSNAWNQINSLQKFNCFDISDDTGLLVGDGIISMQFGFGRVASLIYFNNFYPKIYQLGISTPGTYNYGFNGISRCILNLAANNYFIGGDFSSFTWKNSTTSSIPKFIKLTESDGSYSVAAGWTPGATVITSGNVYCAALQSNGKIIIGGDFTIFNGVDTVYRAARLNTDGTLDNTFNAFNVSDTGTVYAVKVESSGTVLLGGSFPGVSGNATYAKFCRVSSSGSPSNALSSLSGGDAEVRTIAIQSLDNKIVIGGSFTSAGGYARNSIARIDGATFLIDSTLDFNNIFATHSFNAVGPNRINTIKVRDNFSYPGADGKFYIGTEYPIPDPRSVTAPGTYGGLIILNNENYIS